MTAHAPETAPVVSVIIPVYNAAAHLETAVQSVLAQTYPHFELLVVDDGSSDGSLDIARRCAERDPDRIQVLQHPGGINRGVAESRNLAASRARGKYLAFLDADDRWLPEKLARQVEYMEDEPDLGLTFTKARIIREGEGHAFIPGVDVLGNRPPRDHKQALVQIIAVTVNYIFSTVMVRTDCFRAIDGFPESLPYQSEDRLMVARVSADHCVDWVPHVLCEYLAHEESYSARVIRHGTAPLIFFDMQVRMVDWLAHVHDRADWARDIAGALLPVYFAPALFSSRRWKDVRNVLGGMRAVLRTFPDMTVYMARAVFAHSRLGRLLARLRAGPKRAR
jgi:glycosyltransferase involved in cell wall biosynthesis